MTNRFLISVAALALLAGTGAANAQGMGGKNETGGAQHMQQNAQPSGGAAEHGISKGKQEKGEKGTVGQAGGTSGSMKSGQSAEEKPSGAMKKNEMKKNESAEEKAGATKGSRNERAQGEQQGQKSKGMSSENQTKGGKEMNAQGRGGTGTSTSAQGQAGTNMNAQGRTGPGATTSTQTTGQAGAGAKLSTEQRTKITSVFREQHVTPENNVNFSISVGTRVPRERVHLYPLPLEVVNIYPEWRGYEFIRVRDQILVVDPRTFEIVAILEA